MKKSNQLSHNNIAYIINHLGEEEHPLEAVSPPIVQTSNFVFPDIKTMRARLARESEEPFYTRGVNPTVKVLRQKLAALEGTEDALVFASGSAAIAAAVMSEVAQGDHVICIEKPYSWTNKLLGTYLKRFGVSVTFVDGRDVQNFKNAILPNTRLIYLESPNSLTFEMQDLEAVAKLAREHGITTICDNSYSTPLFQQPAALGVDVVVHSATKYLSGHSDVVAGALCTTKKRIEKIFAGEFMTLGGLLPPFESWLAIRGLRTLPLRLAQSDRSAQELVKWLSGHPAIERVYYPFEKNNPQLSLAQKQMKGAGGLFSITLKTRKLEDVEAFCDTLQYFQLGCSWGGYESLQFPQAALIQAQNYSPHEDSVATIRFYAGLEDAEVLKADLEQALEKISL